MRATYVRFQMVRLSSTPHNLRCPGSSQKKNELRDLTSFLIKSRKDAMYTFVRGDALTCASEIEDSPTGMKAKPPVSAIKDTNASSKQA